MSMSILSLPPEIFGQILECIPTQRERQQATLQLTRALPRAPIPLHHLFGVVTLHEAAQVVSLHRRIRSSSGTRESTVEGRDEDGQEERNGCASMIHVLHIDAFDADAEVLLNLLALVNDVEHLRLCVGPLFMPEHLQSALEKPRRRLRRLEVRFRPYVRKANYLPFLKGSYYDAALSELARWPSPSSYDDDFLHAGLHSLSLIQEPLPSTSLHSDDDNNTLANTKGKFAQPIVFFSFHPLAELLASPAMASLRSLSVRIPGRDVTPYLFSSTASSSTTLSPSPSARRIKHLDLSTTSVALRALERLLVRVPNLTHIVLDETNVVPKGEPHAVEESWKTLGKACAFAGAARAKEVEKELSEWLAAAPEDVLGGDGGDPNGAIVGNRDATHTNGRQEQGRAQKKGRRGVAISTISLRGVSSSSSAASSSSGSRPLLNLSKFTIPGILTSSLPSMNSKTKIRLVPPPPTLENVCVTLPRSPHPHHLAAVGPNHNNALDDDSEEERRRIEDEETARRLFKEGWEDGIAQLRVRWGRLRASVSSSSTSSSVPSSMATPSVTRKTAMVLAFKDISVNDDGKEEQHEEELVPATRVDLEMLSNRTFACPTICFAGETKEREREHTDACGHSYK